MVHAQNLGGHGHAETATRLASGYGPRCRSSSGGPGECWAEASATDPRRPWRRRMIAPGARWQERRSWLVHHGQVVLHKGYGLRGTWAWRAPAEGRDRLSRGRADCCRFTGHRGDAS